MKMKKSLLFTAVCGAFITAAQAQPIEQEQKKGQLRISGIIDMGFSWVSNNGGSSQYSLNGNNLQTSRIAFDGFEWINPDLKAYFLLEAGFDPSNPGARSLDNDRGIVFGRQAYAGISSETAGRVSFGVQYDSGVDVVQPTTASDTTGIVNPFDNDNLNNTFSINNSVKYQSPKLWDGLYLTGLFGFSNVGKGTSFQDGTKGSSSTNRAFSLGAGYYAHSLMAGISYVDLKNPYTGNNSANNIGAVNNDYSNLIDPANPGSNTSIQGHRIIAAGIKYTFFEHQQGDLPIIGAIGPLTVGFTYSNSRVEDMLGDKITFNNYHINGKYDITDYLLVAAGYTYTDAKASVSALPEGTPNLGGKYHQASLLFDYYLSKRTDVYLLGIFQKAGGGAPNASLDAGYGIGVSDSSKIFSASVGVRHKF